MKNTDLAITITKLGGVALIVYAIISASSYTPYLVGKADEIPVVDIIAVYISKVVFPILIVCFLIYFGGLLIRRHIPDTKIQQESLAELEKIALSVLGVFLFYYAVSDMVLHLSYLYKIQLMIKSGVPTTVETQMDADTFSAMVATGVELVFSLWLILGSSGMVTLFNRLRTR